MLTLLSECRMADMPVNGYYLIKKKNSYLSRLQKIKLNKVFIPIQVNREILASTKRIFIFSHVKCRASTSIL